MSSKVLLLCSILCTGYLVDASCPKIVTREEWDAKPSKGNLRLRKPVPYVVIHHTVAPKACKTFEECSAGMRSMQKYHQDTRGWKDIGYNFCIGNDENIYTGRGWANVGSHAPKYNTRSIGICFIGNYMEDTPDPKLMELALKLIDCGVEKGFIQSNYKLVGHRQVTNTLCPGDKLYSIVQRQSHYTDTPS